MVGPASFFTNSSHGRSTKDIVIGSLASKRGSGQSEIIRREVERKKTHNMPIIRSKIGSKMRHEQYEKRIGEVDYIPKYGQVLGKLRMHCFLSVESEKEILNDIKSRKNTVLYCNRTCVRSNELRCFRCQQADHSCANGACIWKVAMPKLNIEVRVESGMTSTAVVSI